MTHSAICATNWDQPCSCGYSYKDNTVESLSQQLQAAEAKLEDEIRMRFAEEESHRKTLDELHKSEAKLIKATNALRLVQSMPRSSESIRIAIQTLAAIEAEKRA